MWLEDYCTVCDKVCPSGSIYCSQSCKHADHEKAKMQSAPISPPLLPVQSSVNESGRRSSAIQVQLDPFSPANYLVPFCESSQDRHYRRHTSNYARSSSTGHHSNYDDHHHVLHNDYLRGRELVSAWRASTFSSST
ncbi:uncharacterized protein V2V93DRAFT_358543 [Kockiozyma suomiensis]|uniref:uncharacterized protein n=1 Tax=Kockiozyma suomiensis TaxID=1337062 RepID=UPI0033442898